MAITVTSKYKPFTYEELVKPLEGYWKKYDEAEKELGTLQNDVAQVKSIIETAPENDPIRMQALDLYNQLQKEVDALATEGYTARGRKARLDLKNTFNTLIPRILTAEEAVRKDRLEYSKMDRSGRYIMANSSDNPYAYTWRDYIDGQIPQYTTGIEKAQAYKAGKDAATLISSRVVKDPTFTPKNGYTAITTELGLQYDNANEMMKNQDIATAVENIVNNYTQGSTWSDTSKEALRQEVIRGAYEGLVHKTNTQYQRTKTDTDVTFEQRYTKDGNIAFINPKTGKVVRTETPQGVIVESKKQDNDSQDAIQKVLGSEALPIGDVRFARRVSSREDYLSADGKLNTTQLITNYGDTELKKTKQVRLATASETQNALQNLVKDVIKKYNISGFKSQAEATDYINNNYIVMIEGGKGPGSQDNHVYAVPIQQAVEQLLQSKDYKDSKKKLIEFRDKQSPNSPAYNAFDAAYKSVNIYDYASQLSAYLKNAKEEDLLGKITVEDVLNNEDLRVLGLSEQEIAVALTELDDEARKIFQDLLNKKELKKSIKKLEKPNGTMPKTMG